MTIFEANISPLSVDFFKTNLKTIHTIEQANELLKAISGIRLFFHKEKELTALKNKVEENAPIFEESNRRAYGDFQTNEELTARITAHLYQTGISPELVMEPTCGKGGFILTALKQWTSIKKIVGIEIYSPYIWETKFSILDLFLRKQAVCKPIIEIIHENIFSFDLGRLASEHQHLNTLIIGNPPWVTNSELSTLNSNNLPQKSNFKNHKGIDAITGKGNFDIGEYILLQMLRHFSSCKGTFAFLVKSSVVKNVLYDQWKAKYPIGHIHKFNIDAKKEFNVSVEACLFLTNFNSAPEFTCQELDFYTQKAITEFGWHKDKFVYAINDYDQAKNVDGRSPFVWRQGMKHDCSKIMELNRYDGHFINGFKQEVNPEQDLLYGLLKSSDLKHEVISSYRKTTIVTQKKVGQETNYIKIAYPKTYHYLDSNRKYFDKRKSSIYRGKPPFSIFGIGDYSFAKYKIAISGMYKRTTFSLVLPDKEKPLMLDDTCYFIGFDTMEEAQIAQKILNSDIVQAFLKAIIFSDAKRPITKVILMRIDLEKAYHLLDAETDLSESQGWKLFGEKFKTQAANSSQMSLF